MVVLLVSNTRNMLFCVIECVGIFISVLVLSIVLLYIWNPKKKKKKKMVEKKNSHQFGKEI